MVSIYIHDSGYLSPTNTGTRASSANMVNSGNAIELHGVEFKPRTAANYDVSPTLGVYGTGTDTSGGTVIHVTSVENTGFTLRGVLDLSNATDQALVTPIAQLPRTRWYKLLYFNSLDATQLIHNLADDTFTAGEVTAFSLGGAWKHFHVFVQTVTWAHVARAQPRLEYTIVGHVTKTETSTI